jgi:hypothetical protein
MAPCPVAVSLALIDCDSDIVSRARMGYCDRRIIKPFTEETILMGDKSPKAAQKQASQKKAKVDSADQKKRQDVASKSKAMATKKK